MDDMEHQNWQLSADDSRSEALEVQRLLEDVTRLISDWVWELDDDFRLTFVSPRIFDILGMPALEAVGRRLSDLGAFLGPADEQVEVELRQPFRDHPFVATSRDGERRYMLVSGIPVYDQATGKFTGVRGIARDVTDKRNAELTTLRLVDAVEQFPEIFILCDADDRIIVGNSRFRELNKQVVHSTAPGTPFEEHIRTIVETGLVLDAAGREDEWIAERLEHHRNPSGSFEIQRQDGTYLQIREHRLPNGGTVTFSTDVTHMKMVEEALREKMDRHREFVADMAHELRTPLAVLQANLDNLEDSDVTRSLRQDVDSLSRMVEQLLTETRLEGLVIAPGERADLVDVARTVATNLAPIAIRQKRTIEVTGASSPVLVRGRSDVLEQAVRNLVENAIKYSEPKTVVTIKITDSPAVYVIDRGQGVPRNMRDKVFERYLRLDRKGSGSGLGLSIVRRIAEAHFAVTGIDDAPEGGAVFYLRFPTAQF